MAIAGIDYSLCGPCICIFDGTVRETFGIHRCSFYFLTNVKKHAKVYEDIIYGEMFDDYNHNHPYSTRHIGIGCCDMGHMMFNDDHHPY